MGGLRLEAANGSCSVVGDDRTAGRGLGGDRRASGGIASSGLCNTFV